MNKQRGITFIGLVFVLAVVMFAAIIAMKLVPAYLEFTSVQKSIDRVANEPNFKDMSNQDIKIAFAKSAAIDSIKVVETDDLIIMKNEDGKPIITADYEQRIPLVGNVTALLAFVASSDKAAYLAAPKQEETEEVPAQ